jgi:signal transduction histidine kinase/ligand-binding sensor domain-containing protein
VPLLSSTEINWLIRSVFILLYFLSPGLYAQNHAERGSAPLNFDQPEVIKKAGIKNVRCLFKDSRKLIWIGTDNGLFRYDGTNIFYLRHIAGDTGSIPDNTIASITEDSDGNIWIGTMSGVARMNPYNFHCKVYRDELHNLPGGNFDNKVLITPGGQVWTGNNSGLYLLDKKLDRFKKAWQNVLAGKPVSGYVTSLVYSKPGSLILGTFNDIVFFNTKDYSFKRVLPFKKDIVVTTLFQDREQRLWIGTWGEGCIFSDAGFTNYYQYKWEKDVPSNVDNVVSSITGSFSEKEHAVWICAKGNIIKFPVNKTTGDIKGLKVYNPENSLVSKDPGVINFLLADDENNIWTGGYTVAKFSASKNFFELVENDLSGAVENIQPLQWNGKTYAAVSMWHGNEGFFIMDSVGNIIRSLKSLDNNDPYGTNVSGVAVDKLNRLWLSSLAGVYILNDKLQVLYDLSKTSTHTDPLTVKKTNEILISNDTVWIACYKSGIDLFDLNLHKLRHFSDHDGSGLTDNLVQKIFRDSKGTIWICGNNFLYKYQPSAGKFKKYDLSIEHASYYPRDLAELPGGNLLIAMETGLLEFDVEKETYVFITTPLLEKEQSVGAVQTDANGDVWFLTTNHLVNYKRKERKFTLFGEEDGLNVNSLQYLKTFDGKEFFLAEGKQLIKFTPDNWQKKTVPPEIILHAIKINDSLLSFSKPLTNLELGYYQDKIYIEFDGITYYKPEQNQYAYKLTGIDREWIFTNKNSVSYSNLPPGNYLFQVKAGNYAGMWSKVYAINIAINPPYWKTWWFYGLVFLIATSIFFVIVRYFVQRNLREKILKLEKEQAIEKERNRIAQDMHDDLGSGLTKIAILSEVAKTQLKHTEAAATQLEKISSSSRELVDNLQDIIWVLNSRNDSLENLAAYIREYALKYFDSTEQLVRFNYPNHIPAVKLSEEQRRSIFMVVKETLANSAKHAVAKQIIIALTVNETGFAIEIRDDGKGFEMNAIRPFANGLANMEQRMSRINGSLAISSVPGEGTVTKITVPV